MNVDCDLWSLATVETECPFGARVCVCAIVSEICMCHKDVVGASRGAQSTVDGFNVIHTKLTDSVECSPRQAGQWLWAWVELTEEAGREGAWRRRDHSQSDKMGMGIEEEGRGCCSNHGGQVARHRDIMTQYSGGMSLQAEDASGDVSHDFMWCVFTLEHKQTGSALLHYHHLINQRNSRVFHLQFKTGRNSVWNTDEEEVVSSDVSAVFLSLSSSVTKKSF